MSPSDWSVLVVEDEEDSVYLVAEMLRHHGAAVHLAGDGEEALNTLADLRPQVIIMDLALPRMDGWQALEAIRQNPDIADVPVVAITAYHSSNLAHDAEAAGFDAYFAKPVDVDAFILTLQRLSAD